MDHGSATLGDEVGDATDVDVGGGEGGCHGGLGHREGDSGVGSLQSATIITPVTTHHHLSAEMLKIQILIQLNCLSLYPSDN